MGIWTRIRQNLSLKMISLVAAVLLYVYVQQERNPTIARTVLVTVEYKNRQEGVKVLPDAPHVTVTVTGPRPNVERIKDGDIKAFADLTNITTNQPSAPVRIAYDMPKSIPDVMLDSPPEFIKVQVFREKTRKLKVLAVFSNQPPAGLKYGEPVIHPASVTVRGREDFVNRVDQVVAVASPAEPQGSIDGDFSLTPWDRDRNTVEGVTIEPDKAHVTIPQVLLPSEQLLPIDAILADRPAPPYFISDTVFTPNQVKVSGTPQRVAAIRAIYTETLNVHDLTANTTIDAGLIIPPDVDVRDLQGKPIRHVKVTFIISKKKPEPGPNPETTPPAPLPKRDVPAGQ